MRPMARSWLIGLAVAAAGALLGGAVVWAVQAAVIGDLRSEVAELKSRPTEAEDATADVTTTPEPPSSSATGSPAPDSPAPAKPRAQASTAEDGRHFCFIKSATWQSSTPQISVDYAEFLTGQAAADAAAAAGEESPPPNDFFISNRNTRLRKFPLSTAAKVKMISKSDDLVMEGYSMTVSQWFDAFSGMSGYFPAIRTVPYWITIKNGTVVRIEEQYIP